MPESPAGARAAEDTVYVNALAQVPEETRALFIRAGGMSDQRRLYDPIIRGSKELQRRAVCPREIGNEPSSRPKGLPAGKSAYDR